jgi:hypothetical protein
VENKMKKQKGGVLLLALAGLVVVSAITAASLTLTVQQTEQSQDDVRAMQGTAVADSMRLLVSEGYPEEVAFDWLAQTLYDGNSFLSLGSENGEYSGGISQGERRWGYSFDFSRPVEDITSFYDDSILPSACRKRGKALVCDWNASNSYRCDWNLDLSERVHRPAKYKEPRECKNNKIIEYFGVLRFPDNTIFSVAPSVTVVFQDAVVFNGNLTVLRQGNSSGNILFQESVALLGDFDIFDFIQHSRGIAKTGSIEFYAKSYLGGNMILPQTLSPQSASQNWERLGDYRVITPYYFGEINWQGEKDLRKYVSRDEKPVQVIFHETLLSLGNINSRSFFSPVQGQERSRCGKKQCWSPVILPDLKYDVLSISSTEIGYISTFSSLYSIVVEPYGYLAWEIK